MDRYVVIEQDGSGAILHVVGPFGDYGLALAYAKHMSKNYNLSYAIKTLELTNVMKMSQL